MPHRLYGVLAPPSAARSRAGARSALAEIAAAHAAGRLPIVVGGTGLYLRALTAGARRGPADPAGDPRRGGGTLPQRSAARHSAELSRDSTRTRRRACRPATASA